MHDIPRKDREDADDVDEEEVAEVSGGYIDPDRICFPPGYPQYPGGIRDPGDGDPVDPTDPPYDPR